MRQRPVTAACWRKRTNLERREQSSRLQGLFGGHAGLEPVGDGLEGFGGEGFFDGGVFGGRTGVGMLEEVVEFSDLANIDVFVAGVGEGFLNERHIDLGRNLKIFLAVEDEDGASGFLEIGKRVVVEEETEPR